MEKLMVIVDREFRKANVLNKEDYYEPMALLYVFIPPNQ